jgi:hypothetical protein
LSDETPEQPVKKRVGRPSGPATRPEGKRAPEPPVKLSAEDKEKLASTTDDELFLTEQEILCVTLSFRKDRETAAVRLGWSMRKVKDCLAQPHVKLYAYRWREEFIKEAVRREVTEYRRKGITPLEVQKRLMDIAMMPPAETKGSVDGQVKALQELSAHMGLKKDDGLGDKTEEELKAIVAGTRGKIPETPTVQ